jgi:AcrR family transcriptional regulator
MKTLAPSSQETKQRVLEAAGEVFAEQGYRAATVRGICERAGANVAAVNYYFGDKDRLYEAVVRLAQDSALEQYPPHAAPDASEAEKLHTFVRSLLLRVLDEGRPAWHGKLMAREMVEPTHVLDLIVKDTLRAQFDLLSGIVRAIIGRRASVEQVRLCASSIVGQCLFYRHAQPVIQRMFPQQKAGLREIERLAEHITQFSLAALDGSAHARDARPSS